MIRKFLDPAVAEPAAPNTTTEPVSIAALMAKQGVKSSSESQATTPYFIQPEKKEEPVKAPEVTPAATATEPPKAEPASPESQKPAEPTPTPTVQKEPEPVKVPTWQEVLKQQPDTKVILKELGFDDSLVNL